MRYQPHVQPLETDGFGETRNFAIAATGKAFRNLMDGLYGRKIEAVVREISTNALDSHIAAGTPGRQWLLQLPTLMKPTFAVRDYGTGMPHRQVMERYSTLFDSTKDQSDEAVGMLGLGSKSPFAYTDGFTLRCWDGEVRRTYASYLGAGGVPMISVADVSASNEPRGVEVSFPVKSTDFAAFELAAARVLKGFSTQPLGVPASVQRALQVQPERYGTGWALVRDNYLPKTSKVWALQGCVYYPVELAQLDLPKEEAVALQNLTRQLLLDFDIGQLEFTPGRETLSYTAHTVRNLRAVWERVRAEITVEYTAEFQDCTTAWERAVLIEQRGLGGLYGGLFRLSEYSREAQKIAGELEEMIPPLLSGKDFDPARHVFTVVFADGTTARSSNRKDVARIRGCLYNGKPLLWVERTPGVTTPWRRVHQYMQLHGYSRAVAYDGPEYPDQPSYPLQRFGNPVPVRTADLPPPPPAPRGARAAYQRYSAYTGALHRSWEHVEEDELPANSGFLFELDGFIVAPQPKGAAHTWPVLYNRSTATRQARLARAAGLTPPTLVHLRRNEVLHRWRKLAQFAGVPEDFVLGLPEQHVLWLVALRNHQRFQGSYYAKWPSLADSVAHTGATTRPILLGTQARHLPRAPVAPDNPLLQLGRFAVAAGAVPAEYRSRLGDLLECLPLLAQEHLTDRALALGVEVLPEPCSRSHQFPWPLVPLHWENMGRMLAGDAQAPGSPSLVFQLIARMEQ